MKEETHLEDLDVRVASGDRERLDESSPARDTGERVSSVLEKDKRAEARYAPAHARVLLGPDKAHDEEQAALVVRRRERDAVVVRRRRCSVLVDGAGLTLEVGAGLGERRRVDDEARDLVEVEDGPVFGAVVRAVGEHVLGEEAVRGVRGQPVGPREDDNHEERKGGRTARLCRSEPGTGGGGASPGRCRTRRGGRTRRGRGRRRVRGRGRARHARCSLSGLRWSQAVVLPWSTAGCSSWARWGGAGGEVARGASRARVDWGSSEL